MLLETGRSTKPDEEKLNYETKQTNYGTHKEKKLNNNPNRNKVLQIFGRNAYFDLQNLIVVFVHLFVSLRQTSPTLILVWFTYFKNITCIFTASSYITYLGTPLQSEVDFCESLPGM